MYQGVGARSGGMWQGVGVCGRVWGHVAGVDVCGRGSGLRHRQGHVARVGTCGRVWGYVAGCGGMWQGVPKVCVCVCGLSVCRVQVDGWSIGWVIKWVGGQVGVWPKCVCVVKVCGQSVCMCVA